MLAARLLPAHTVPAVAGLRLSVVEGCFAMLPQTFTGGVFLSGFALLLGANAWQMGLIMAIPTLGQWMQLLAATWIARGADRRAMTVWCASISRYLWLPIATIPFLPLDRKSVV